MYIYLWPSHADVLDEARRTSAWEANLGPFLTDPIDFVQ